MMVVLALHFESFVYLILVDRQRQDVLSILQCSTIPVIRKPWPSLFHRASLSVVIS